MSTKFAVLFWMLVLVFGLAACGYSEMDTIYDTEPEGLPPPPFPCLWKSKEGAPIVSSIRKKTK